MRCSRQLPDTHRGSCWRKPCHGWRCAVVAAAAVATAAAAAGATAKATAGACSGSAPEGAAMQRVCPGRSGAHPCANLAIAAHPCAAARTHPLHRVFGRFGGVASFGAGASRRVGATVGAGLARDPGGSGGQVASKLCSYNRERGECGAWSPIQQKLRRPRHGTPDPQRSRRTPYSGSPGQAAHGCAAAASAHKDVRPSGDLETRSTAAPTEAALVDRTSARTSTRARAVTWRPGVCGPGRSRRFRRFRLSSAGTDRQLDQAADEACVRRATRARRRSSARNTAGVV